MKEVQSQFTSRGFRNLNPFNIRYNKRNNWIGLVGHDEKGFCRFNSLENGVRAGIKLLINYVRNKVDTPAKIIRRYAPSNENSTDLYIEFVCAYAGLSENQEISNWSQFKWLVLSILRYENGKPAFDARFEMLLDIINSFKSLYDERKK